MASLSAEERTALRDAVTRLLADRSSEADVRRTMETARGYDEWQENHSWLLGPASAQIVKFLETFKDYPPRARSFDLDLDQLVESLNPARTR